MGTARRFSIEIAILKCYFCGVMEDIYRHRPLLFSLAYNILGEVQEAEDIVQDVFENWFSKRPEVKYPKAYLSRAVVNRSIDRLEALKKAREVYKGPWLPVPLVSHPSDPDSQQIVDPLPYALICLLEKLNPVERAAFVLRHAFDYAYKEIAEMFDQSEDNVRQMVHRAHEKLQRPRVRYEASAEDRQRLLNVFLQAAEKHDSSVLKDILHRDAIMYTDGGGKVSAAVVPVRGSEKIITFVLNVLKGATDVFDVKPVMVNGSAGALIINRSSGKPDSICTLDTQGNHITGLYFVRNPNKLLM